MIKIIKPGNRQKVECKSCGCIFTFEYEDVELGNQFDPENFVKCPCCGDYTCIRVMPKK